MKKTILYVGWVGFGNQGDDLCYQIFQREMTQKAKERGLHIRIKALFPAKFNEFTLARLHPDLVVLGAGSLFEPVYLKPLVLAQQSSIPTAIWGSGYDSLLPSPIDASLINPDSAFMIRQVVQHAHVVGVRGPYTMEMLDSIGATHPELQIVGDPGLLLEKQDDDVTLAEINHLEGPIISVNWGTASNKVLGGNEKSVARDLSVVLSELASKTMIVIYPVWPRDIAACSDLYEAIDHPNSIFLDRVPKTDELIDLYQKSSFSLNMKLHANVFSAAANCPFICLAYRMKGYDFADSLAWTDFTILFSAEDRQTQIRLAAEKLSSNNEKYTELLDKNAEQYRAKLSILGDRIAIPLLNR